MKKLLTTISTLVITLVVMGVITGGVNAQATEAQTPIKAYNSNGIEYELDVWDLKVEYNEYYRELKRISDYLYPEIPTPEMYTFFSWDLPNELCGFQLDFSDGSKAIYLNCYTTERKGKMVYVHEMNHIKYDTGNSSAYKKAEQGYYLYPVFMEYMTDYKAEADYNALKTGVQYERANHNVYLDTLMVQPEVREVLIQIYEGKIKGDLAFIEEYARTGKDYEKVRRKILRMGDRLRSPLFYITHIKAAEIMVLPKDMETR